MTSSRPVSPFFAPGIGGGGGVGMPWNWYWRGTRLGGLGPRRGGVPPSIIRSRRCIPPPHTHLGGGVYFPRGTGKDRFRPCSDSRCATRDARSRGPLERNTQTHQARTPPPPSPPNTECNWDDIGFWKCIAAMGHFEGCRCEQTGAVRCGGNGNERRGFAAPFPPPSASPLV